MIIRCGRCQRKNRVKLPDDWELCPGSKIEFGCVQCHATNTIRSIMVGGQTAVPQREAGDDFADAVDKYGRTTDGKVYDA